MRNVGSGVDDRWNLPSWRRRVFECLTALLKSNKIGRVDGIGSGKEARPLSSVIAPVVAAALDQRVAGRVAALEP